MDGPGAGMAAEVGDPPIRRGIVVLEPGGFGEQAHRYYLSTIDATGATYIHGGLVTWPPEAGPHVVKSGQPDTPTGPDDPGQQVLGRICGARTVDRDEPTDWHTRLAQYDAVCTCGQPNHSLLQRVSAIDKPVFVAPGRQRPMILPRYSYLLAGLIPGRV